METGNGVWGVRNEGIRGGQEAHLLGWHGQAPQARTYPRLSPLSPVSLRFLGRMLAPGATTKKAKTPAPGKPGAGAARQGMIQKLPVIGYQRITAIFIILLLSEAPEGGASSGSARHRLLTHSGR